MNEPNGSNELNNGELEGGKLSRRSSQRATLNEQNKEKLSGQVISNKCKKEQTNGHNIEQAKLNGRDEIGLSGLTKSINF